jgi:hypothetical protein
MTTFLTGSPAGWFVPRPDLSLVTENRSTRPLLGRGTRSGELPPRRSACPHDHARCLRSRRSNLRPRSDQFKFSGSATTASARSIGNRGSTVGTAIGRPRSTATSRNSTRGSMVSSNPAAPKIRSAVCSVGDLRRCSYAESVGRDVPAAVARSACDRPAARRACSKIVAAPGVAAPEHQAVAGTGQGLTEPDRRLDEHRIGCPDLHRRRHRR